DQALATVYEPLLLQAHEGLDHRRRRALIHGEDLARPVSGGAHAAHLALDGVAGLLLPLPDLADEALAAPRVAGLALARGGELAADHHLGRAAGMRAPRLPQGAVAAHAVVAHQRVLQGVLERVAHVQGAGDVGRRQQDRIGRAVAARRERARRLPLGVQAGLEASWVVAGGEGHVGCSSHISCLFTCSPRAWYCFQRSRSGPRAAGSAGTTSSTRSKPPSTAASRRLTTSGRIGGSYSGAAISTSTSPSPSGSSPAIWWGMKTSSPMSQSMSSTSSAWARSRASTRVGSPAACALRTSSHTSRIGSSRKRG